MFNDKNMNMNGFIQGKRIDFNEEIFEYENENEKEKNQNISNSQNINQNINLNNQNMQNNNNNNKIYNNINNIIINNNSNNNNNNNNNDLNNQNIQNYLNTINNNDDNLNHINQNTNNNNNLANNTYINQQHLNMNVNISKIKCTCSKTGCQKKYCACLSLGKFCDGCNCKNCENQPNFKNKNNIESNIEKINYSNSPIINPKTQRVICNCTKSNCMKKYCECFKQGLICNSLCRCRECNNNNSCINDYNNVNNNIIKNNENRNINIKNDNNHFGPEYIEYNYNPINFQPEAFGISIKKEKLKVYERKINLNTVNSMNVNKNIIKEGEISTYNRFNETPKYSSRKRARSKIDISNMKTCPTSNSSNRRKKGLSNVNKNIQKKKLQLN